eukprot:scaffold16280_cov15-Tisochrysis_lutea.AAC.1
MFAPHLEKCMGKGRAAGRAASKRIQAQTRSLLRQAPAQPADCCDRTHFHSGSCTYVLLTFME